MAGVARDFGEGERPRAGKRPGCPARRSARRPTRSPARSREQPRAIAQSVHCARPGVQNRPVESWPAVTVRPEVHVRRAGPGVEDRRVVSALAGRHFWRGNRRRVESALPGAPKRRAAGPHGARPVRCVSTDALRGAATAPNAGSVVPAAHDRHAAVAKRSVWAGDAPSSSRGVAAAPEAPLKRDAAPRGDAVPEGREIARRPRKLPRAARTRRA